MTEKQTVSEPTQVEPTLKPGTAQEGESDEAKAERAAALREAYSKAQTALRLAHLDEFNGLVKDNAKTAGYDWKPKPTKAERARAEIERLAQEAGLDVQVSGS